MTGTTPIQAVKDLSLTVEDKELLVLVGPSGCGKTTTLRLIAGLEAATGGTITMDGVVLNNVPPQDRDIAMVFQSHALYPHLTVFENMALGLRLRKRPAKEIEHAVREAADLLELSPCLKVRPEQLSGGQRQRVALGRAIVRRPRLFLLDEPLSSLDAPLRVQMRAEIIRLQRHLGITMLLVTHDQTDAMSLGHRIAVLKSGELQQVATPPQLYRAPANRFVASFVGLPPMQFIPGLVRKNNAGLTFTPIGAGEGTCSLPIDKMHAPRLEKHLDREILLGVRPEHFAVQTLPGTSGATMTALVESTEYLGAETILQVKRAELSLRLRLIHSQSAMFSSGQPIGILPDMSQACYFDASTGEATHFV